MNDENSNATSGKRLRRLSNVLLIAAFACVGLAAANPTISRPQVHTSFEYDLSVSHSMSEYRAEAVVRTAQEQTYDKVWTTVRDNFAGTLPADFDDWRDRFNGYLNDDKSLVVAIGALLKAVGQGSNDAYQLSTEDTDSWIAASNGGVKMIGMQFNLRATITSATVPVTKIFDPSITSIAVGDEIVAIEGVKVQGQRTDELYKRLQGEPGGAIKLTVKRGTKTLDVSVNRSGSGNVEVEFKPKTGDVACVVEAIVPNSPAQAAGLQKGDVVKKIGDYTVDSQTSQYDVLAAVRKVPLGKSTDVVVERNGADVVLHVTPGLVAKKDLFVQAEIKPTDLFIQWTFEPWRLDSVNIPAYLDDEFIDKAQQLAGGVIDLRARGAVDPAIVAGVIARFTQTQGTVLSYTSKVSGKEVLTNYVVRGDELVKVSNGVETPVGKIAKRFTGKFAVTIDQTANGAGAYVAAALQRTGVKVVGIKTKAVKMYTIFGFGNGVAIWLYTGNFVNPDGTAFSGVTPDVPVTGKDFALPSDAEETLSGF